jgi:hypothetical protein
VVEAAATATAVVVVVAALVAAVLVLVVMMLHMYQTTVRAVPTVVATPTLTTIQTLPPMEPAPTLMAPTQTAATPLHATVRFVHVAAGVAPRAVAVVERTAHRGCTMKRKTAAAAVAVTTTMETQKDFVSLTPRDSLLSFKT